MATPSPQAAPADQVTLDRVLDRLAAAQEQLRQREEQIAAVQDEQATAKQSVIEAELKQDDLFTRRARPSVVYAGLLFIFLNYVLFPLIFKITGHPLSKEECGAFKLPEDFWWAWGGVVATWSIGRSFEKVGVSNRVTRMITGTNPPTKTEPARDAPSDGAVG